MSNTNTTTTMNNSEIKATALANLDMINESVELYKIANRVANNAFVIVATDNEGETACLTKQGEGHSFGGGPSGAVVFHSKGNAERAAKHVSDLFGATAIRPTVVGLGTAYRRKLAALLDIRRVMKKAIEAIGE